MLRDSITLEMVFRLSSLQIDRQQEYFLSFDELSIDMRVAVWLTSKNWLRRVPNFMTFLKQNQCFSVNDSIMIDDSFQQVFETYKEIPGES